MFKVGMGEKPQAPESLSQEGHDFIDHCLQHDPKQRLTAVELLEQNFCKVHISASDLEKLKPSLIVFILQYGRDECSSEQLQVQVRGSFRRNVATS